MQTAMVFTRQKPIQRKRVGELPEGLPGATTSVGSVERSVKHVGGPDGSWGANPREATSTGGPRTVRASDPRIVRGDGRAAHPGKGRTGIRSLQRHHGPHMKDQTPMPTALQGIAQKAARQQGYRVRTRYGRLDEDVLQQGWRDSRKDAASGVDQVSAQAYAPHLDEHIPRLVERLQQQRDRATRVSRHDRPQGDGPQRPLGIPAVEDTRRHLAVARLLEAIDAQDFRRCRDGYRPQGGARDAGDTLTITRPCGRDAWVVEVDINTFCDPIDHDGMVRM
jgi:hypothetical protein